MLQVARLPGCNCCMNAAVATAKVSEEAAVAAAGVVRMKGS